MNTTTDSTDAAELFFSGASSAGLRRVLVCPGSRSSPLAFAAWRRPNLRVDVHLDERTAAFAALGEAKASGEPVAVVCTSGTAAANFAPAVAEASMSNVSLVLISADRPPEHQGWGVGQSVDQRGLFGSHVRAEITMPVGATGGDEFNQRVGWRAAATAVEERGPVHVNWPFRLPLEPADTPVVSPAELPALAKTMLSRCDEDLAVFTAALRLHHDPVIIAGPGAVANSIDAERLLGAAQRLNIPVFADILSGLRGNGPLVPVPSLTIDSAGIGSGLVIRLGDTPTAKSLRLWWESQQDAQHVLIDPHRRWHDPSHAFTERLTSDPAWLFEAAAKVEQKPRNAVQQWREAGENVERSVSNALEQFDAFTEPHVAQILAKWAEDTANTTIIASSSMPIRDLDTFSSATAKLRVISNRGVNGIDGVIATAIGVERAVKKRVAVLVGDVAALHDVGSILDAARRGTELTIIIPNNDGGGIFSHLPIRSALPAAAFDELFHTPHGTDFSFLGALDNVRYQLASSANELMNALQGTPDQSVSVVEVPVNTNDRLRLSNTIAAGR